MYKSSLIAEENFLTMSEQTIRFLKETKVTVSLDDEVVHDGTLFDFMDINEFDEYLLDIVMDLKDEDTISFKELSGDWHISKNKG